MTAQQNGLLFYDAYESFYQMAADSQAFRFFCKEAFGEDFSQDGFSDVNQINMILQHVQLDSTSRILDIGCGNGKMLGYLQQKTGAYIHGFDYSEHAIQTARLLHPSNANFRVGRIGECDYAPSSFDLVTSMDTIYFAKDLTRFVSQIKSWLKKDGVLIAGYQEGDVIPRTENVHSAALTKALIANRMPFQAIDITRQTYDLLVRKRKAALNHQSAFEKEGRREWFDLLVLQTEYICKPYELFEKEMARYLYIANKQ